MKDAVLPMCGSVVSSLMEDKVFPCRGDSRGRRFQGRASIPLIGWNTEASSRLGDYAWKGAVSGTSGSGDRTTVSCRFEPSE